jgi:hypothetical protein
VFGKDCLVSSSEHLLCDNCIPIVLKVLGIVTLLLSLTVAKPQLRCVNLLLPALNSHRKQIISGESRFSEDTYPRRVLREMHEELA